MQSNGLRRRPVKVSHYIVVVGGSTRRIGRMLVKPEQREANVLHVVESQRRQSAARTLMNRPVVRVKTETIEAVSPLEHNSLAG